MFHLSTNHQSYYQTLFNKISDVDTIHLKGKITSVDGLLVRAKYIYAEIGTECSIGEHDILAEVIAVSSEYCLLACYEKPYKIKINDDVRVMGESSVNVCESMLGRVIDGLGRPMDGLGNVHCSERYPLQSEALSVLTRPVIKEQFLTNVKAIDVFTPLGKGQRIGIFSGSGVGKSTLLGMIAQHSSADVNVVALIGERGREVRELIEQEIGEEGMKKTILVVATSEESAAIRLRAIFSACAIAEYFRDKGADVNFMVDSLTRVAHAQREIGILRGEPPVARGFPSSLYRVLPRIVERCGTSEHGTITGIFTVLVEGDDEDEPVSDIVRGIVDGHIILRRELAEQMHYPAIDIVSSLSRLSKKIQKSSLYEAAGLIRERLSMYEGSKDIINAGVYTSGSNRKLDLFLHAKDDFDAFIKQKIEGKSSTKEVEDFVFDFVERL